MIFLSAIVIARNEEKNIKEALSSLSFCDERIVVDGGSTDHTVEISKECGAIVLVHRQQNFSSARNLGAEKAQGKWLLYVDADERVDETLKDAILRVIKQQKEVHAAYNLTRKNFYLGLHEWPKTESLTRLMQKSHLKGWYGQLHETPIIKGSIGELPGYLLHYTHQSLSEMLAKTIEWSTIEAKLRYEANHPRMTWWRFPLVMSRAFFSSYIAQDGWRAGTVGLIESIYQAFSMFITYAKLWEMQEKRKYKI